MAQQEQLKIAKLKYNGGGDWYANKTALTNLAEFCNNAEWAFSSCPSSRH